MRSLIFATQNIHKAREVEDLLGGSIHIHSLNEYGITEELPENGFTLEANAKEKVEYVFGKTQLPCFAEDSGLEVDALNGDPGVYTARYAGPERNDIANMQKVLTLLEGKLNRRARFKTVVAYKPDAYSVFLFEGIIPGHIALDMVGDKGFGYDPIFIPEGYENSFGELGNSVKNLISHRARAIAKLKEHLLVQ